MKRCRIIFIDDEEVIRESFLKLVDWEAYSFEVVGVFRDGETAWNYISEHGAEIVVTDINMPFMTGIDLLERIRAEKPEIRVLMLTGYEQFEYAKRAVQLKAFDFLMKPVTTEKLLKAVQKAASDIEREEVILESVDRGQEFFRSVFAEKLLWGKLSGEEIVPKSREAGFTGAEQEYLVIETALDAVAGSQLSEADWTELRQELLHRFTQEKDRFSAEENASVLMCSARGEAHYIRLLLASFRNGLFTETFVNSLAERFLQTGKELRDCRLTICAGKCRTSLAEIPHSFERIQDMLKNRHILGVGKLYFETDESGERNDQEKIVLPTDTLLSHIRLGMTEEVQEDIRRIYRSMHENGCLSLESARMVTTELAITAFKGETDADDESVSYLYYLNHIQQLNTLEEMAADILSFASRVANHRRDGSNRKKMMVSQALVFLKENYGNDQLGLPDVAAYLNISVPYLAVLFKQETGQTFSTHLLKIRMEQAKILLRTHDLTVGEVSDRVGFSNAQYFATCFKKYAGVSPGSYRE